MPAKSIDERASLTQAVEPLGTNESKNLERGRRSGDEVERVDE